MARKKRLGLQLFVYLIIFVLLFSVIWVVAIYLRGIWQQPTSPVNNYVENLDVQVNADTSDITIQPLDTDTQDTIVPDTNDQEDTYVIDLETSPVDTEVTLPNEDADIVQE